MHAGSGPVANEYTGPDPMREVLRTGVSALSVEVSIERPDGSLLPVEIALKPFAGAHGPMVIAAIIDS